MVYVERTLNVDGVRRGTSIKKKGKCIKFSFVLLPHNQLFMKTSLIYFFSLPFIPHRPAPPLLFILTRRRIKWTWTGINSTSIKCITLFGSEGCYMWCVFVCFCVYMCMCSTFTFTNNNNRNILDFTIHVHVLLLFLLFLYFTEDSRERCIRLTMETYWLVFFKKAKPKE